MEKPNATLIQSLKPASFQERGVAVPFTTPALAGARIRPADRTGTEFVVPNPSGGRGVYILTWTGVKQLCRPTVHDTLLHQRVSRLPVMSPAGVRATARQLAAEGLAGKEATLAAAASVVLERKELVLVNFLMLVTLMEQVEPAGLRISADTEHTPEIDRRAQRIVAHVAPAVGRTPTQIGEDLEALSTLFVPVGLRAETPPARLPKLMTRLTATADGLAAWAEQFKDDSRANLASSLSRSALVTTTAAATAHNAALDLTDNMMGLLLIWAGNPTEVIKQTSRPEWILDGWERFCLLWETATTISTQSAALLEMAQLVPMLPKEGTTFGQERSELEKLEPGLRNAQLNVSWRGGGALQGLIARNEKLQGLIA
ncbi:MAG: hypothetical protein ABSE20_15970 [Acetobacteraceae bacterium]|jgi:hypothetical protein